MVSQWTVIDDCLGLAESTHASTDNEGKLRRKSTINFFTLKLCYFIFLFTLGSVHFMQYMCTNFVQEMERQGVHGTNIRPLHLFQCCDIFRSLPVRQTFAVYRRCIGSPILTRLPSSIVGQFTDSNLSAFIVLLFFGTFFYVFCFCLYDCLYWAGHRSAFKYMENSRYRSWISNRTYCSSRFILSIPVPSFSTPVFRFVLPVLAARSDERKDGR